MLNKKRLSVSDIRSSYQMYSKFFFKISQNSQKNTSARLSFLIKLQASACNFIKKGTLVQMFSYDFYKVFENTSLQNTSKQQLFWTIGQDDLSITFVLLIIYTLVISLTDKLQQMTVMEYEFMINNK